MQNSLSRIEFFNKKPNKAQPFFLTIAPVAPHVESKLPKPLARHKQEFPEAKAPRRDNFNPSDSVSFQKPSWLKQLKQLTESQIDDVDTHFRSRIQALQGVDEIVEDVVEWLYQYGGLKNTYSESPVDPNQPLFFMWS